MDIKHILIVDDEIRMRKLLIDYLKREGFECLEAGDGLEAVTVFEKNQIDIILLDIMMPKMDGYTFSKYVRSHSNVPIILITAKSEDEDKLLGYELGCDDYVTKPFSPKVLVAKIKAILKRTFSNEIDNNIMNFNGLEINSSSYEVMIDGENIDLTPKEFELLIYLINNKGIVLSRSKILDTVWGMDFLGDLRTVDTTVKRLREKLLHKSSYIVTIRGVGYKFEVNDN